jgi:hypothetical protein
MSRVTGTVGDSMAACGRGGVGLAGGGRGVAADAEEVGDARLFFQELVMAVETRVRDCWDQADRLHEAFAESITQILTYRNMGQDETLAEQQRGRESSSTADSCNELSELLNIAIRVIKGICLGWLTLTHEQNHLQRQPASALSDAWTKLLQPDDENALQEFATDTTDCSCSWQPPQSMLT